MADEDEDLQLRKFTWEKNDVEHEFVPDPGAAPVMTEKQRDEARRQLAESRATSDAAPPRRMYAPYSQPPRRR